MAAVVGWALKQGTYLWEECLLLRPSIGYPFWGCGDRTQQQLLGSGGWWPICPFRSAHIPHSAAMEWVGQARRTGLSSVCSGFHSTNLSRGGVRPLTFEEEAAEPPWKGCCVSGFCFMSESEVRLLGFEPQSCFLQAK